MIEILIMITGLTLSMQKFSCLGEILSIVATKWQVTSTDIMIS